MAAELHTEHPVHPALTIAELAVMNLAQWRAALRSSLGSTDDPSDRAT
jgi:hypothetical protein